MIELNDSICGLIKKNYFLHISFEIKLPLQMEALYRYKCYCIRSITPVVSGSK